MTTNDTFPVKLPLPCGIPRPRMGAGETCAVRFWLCGEYPEIPTSLSMLHCAHLSYAKASSSVGPVVSIVLLSTSVLVRLFNRSSDYDFFLLSAMQMSKSEYGDNAASERC